MKTELKIKLEDLVNWIKYVSERIKIDKVSVLMNDNITGFITSQIALDIFTKDNVVNVIIPCYSNIEYLLTSAKFSNERGIKYKSIGIKQIYDSIMEKDIETSEPIDIITMLRNQIMDVISFKNDSMVFSIMNKLDNTYFFQITKTDKFFSSSDKNISFTKEELDELAIYLDIKNGK